MYEECVGEGGMTLLVSPPGPTGYVPLPEGGGTGPPVGILERGQRGIEVGMLHDLRSPSRGWSAGVHNRRR